MARSGCGSVVFATLVILSVVGISSNLRDSHQAVSRSVRFLFGLNVVLKHAVQLEHANRRLTTE